MDGDGFGAGVDGAAADARVFGPEGDEAPAHDLESAGTVEHDGGLLRGGDVEVGEREGDGRFGRGRLEVLGQGLGAGAEVVAGAHGVVIVP